jgi:hypothetical protein
MTGHDIATERGIYSRFIDSTGALIETAWNTAAEIRDAVGTCRRCPGIISALPTTTDGRITWFEARCGTCQALIALPSVHGAAVPLRRSSRHDEAPIGAEARRTQFLTQMRDLGKETTNG